MTKDPIEIGGTYEVKVGGRRSEVRIERALPRGDWEGTSLATNKKVRLKAKQIIKALPGAEGPADSATEAEAESDSPRKTVPVPVEDAPEPVAAPETTEHKPAVPDEVADATPVAAPAAKTKVPRKGKEKAAKATGETKPSKGLSCLEAAVQVLTTSGQPMACKAMIDAMAEKGLWTSNAPTPASTLYSAILREITVKGATSRFKKTERGHFALNA